VKSPSPHPEIASSRHVGTRKDTGDVVRPFRVMPLCHSERRLVGAKNSTGTRLEPGITFGNSGIQATGESKYQSPAAPNCSSICVFWSDVAWDLVLRIQDLVWPGGISYVGSSCGE